MFSLAKYKRRICICISIIFRDARIYLCTKWKYWQPFSRAIIAAIPFPYFHFSWKRLPKWKGGIAFQVESFCGSGGFAIFFYDSGMKTAESERHRPTLSIFSFVFFLRPLFAPQLRPEWPLVIIDRFGNVVKYWLSFFYS